MASLLQPGKWLFLFRPVLAGVASVLLAGGSVGWSAVTLTADPDYPDFPDVFTTDPLLVTNASRNIAADRNLRQTFKNADTFDVGQIVLGIGIAAPAGGLVVDIYEVDDVLAAAWTPGTLVHTLSIPTTINTNDRIGITLTESDVFTLPARFDGTTGYGLEVSNADATTNIGPWVHTFDGVDHYPDGVFYVESGEPSGGAGSTRDVGLSLLAVGAGPATPGDVDGDGDVDLDDLDIIAANFRQGAAQRAMGDLTGDAQVDLFDFRAWRAEYPGALPAGFQLGVTAPEPGASLLSFIALCLSGSTSRRRGRGAPVPFR